VIIFQQNFVHSPTKEIVKDLEKMCSLVVFKISLIFLIWKKKICQIIDIKKLKKKPWNSVNFFWTIFLEDFFNKINGKIFGKCFLT
jgi:hypothetical protein